MSDSYFSELAAQHAIDDDANSSHGASDT